MRGVLAVGCGIIAALVASGAGCSSESEDAPHIDAELDASNGHDGASPGPDRDGATPLPDGSTPDGDAGDTDVGDASDGDASDEDASNEDAGDVDAGPPPCPPGAVCDGTYNYAFVTSTKQLPATFGGTAGADAICNQRAQAAGLPGEYVAWLSSSSSNAKDRLGGASGWLRTDRRPFAASADDLFATKLLYPLKLDENGVEGAEETVVTGTLPQGIYALDTCGDWALSAPTDRVMSGYPWMGNTRWSSGALGQCHLDSRLYCLGKDHVAPIPITPMPGRKAFVTQAVFDPSGGMAGADTLCQNEATAAAFTGTFKALLATSTASAISRFSTNGPTWMRVDGIPLWSTAADAAADARILAPLLLHTDGSPASSWWLWMGSESLHAPGTKTCEDWTSNSSAKSGSTAFTDQSGDFTQSYLTCDRSAAMKVGIACFEE